MLLTGNIDGLSVGSENSGIRAISHMSNSATKSLVNIFTINLLSRFYENNNMRDSLHEQFCYETL